MAFSTYSRRRRRSANWRVINLLFLVALVVCGLVYAYQIGVAAREAQTETLEADLERYRERNLEIRDELALALQRQRDTEAAFTELRQRYEIDVPQGVVGELLEEMRQQLERGVDADRLAFLIEAAGAAPACTGEPVTKRFVVRTPVGQGPVSAVRFEDRVVVTASGASATAPNGLPEAWYDPAAPVRLAFRNLAGEVETAEGVLPLQHAMLVDGREYRFTAIPGERALVEVTAQACELPGNPTEIAIESG